MARGLFKVRDGWGNQHGVRVQYPGGNELEIPIEQYEALINCPPANELPWEIVDPLPEA